MNFKLKNINKIIEHCFSKKLQVICLWPNADFGTDKIAKSIRILRESGIVEGKRIKFFKNLPVSIYIKLIIYIMESVWCE